MQSYMLEDPNWANVLPQVQPNQSNTFSIYPQLTLGQEVTGLLFSPDARYLAAAGHGKMKVWDVQAHRELREITNIQCFADVTYNTTSWWVLCVGRNGNYISLFDILSDTIALTFKHTNDQITCIASSADGRYCAVGSYDGTLSLYDLNAIVHSKQKNAQLPVIAPLWSAQATSSGSCVQIAFMPDGSRIATAYRDQLGDIFREYSMIELRGMVNGTLVSTISNLPYGVKTLQFTSDSHYLLLSDGKMI